MPQSYRPEFLRRLLHWLDGERWCRACQAWTPLGHRDGHPPAAGKLPMKRRYDDSAGGEINRRRS